LETYEQVKTKATGIAGIVNNLNIVKEFRAMALKIQENHNGETFVGPTGHMYPIDRPTFRSSLTNYLQTFESPFLCVSTMETLYKFPTSQLLYHFHDGTVIAVENYLVEEFLPEISEQIELVGTKLGLKFPQRIELKNPYPTKKLSEYKD